MYLHLRQNILSVHAQKKAVGRFVATKPSWFTLSLRRPPVSGASIRAGKAGQGTCAFRLGR